MSYQAGYKGRTTVSAGTYYAPYVPTGLDDDSMFYSRAEWELSFALWPRRCKISNKRIWLKRGYKGTATWHGPGDAVDEVQWHDRDEHIIFQLKRQYGN